MLNSYKHIHKSYNKPIHIYRNHTQIINKKSYANYNTSYTNRTQLIHNILHKPWTKHTHLTNQIQTSYKHLKSKNTYAKLINKTYTKHTHIATQHIYKSNTIHIRIIPNSYANHTNIKHTSYTNHTKHLVHILQTSYNNPTQIITHKQIIDKTN